jgi:hypothetical protein
MSEPVVIAPLVHLNGTSKAELLHQIVEASKAISAAMFALAQASPHGRDYYPKGPDVLRAALAAHRTRVDRLIDIQRELEAIGAAIAAQGRPGS